MKIENGAVTLVERQETPTVTLSDGRVVEDVPPRTVVRLTLKPAERSNIQVEVWLPDPPSWNGRFLGSGNGGSAGSIGAGGLAWPVQGGYAVASTDMGTAPNELSGAGNEEVWKDFGYRATHLMTVAAKQVVEAFYGRKPEFSYFNGGSTGGQQALQEAQRYPEDYDGILAAIPAHCRTPLHAYFLWNEQILRDCPFSEEQEAHVIAAGFEYMAPREIPAAAGKFVSDPRGTSADIEAVIALARKNDASLTDRHAAALRKLFTGPVHEVTGERIFGGVPFGSSLFKATGHLYLFKWVFGAERDPHTLNFGADIDMYTAALGPHLNAENPDLSAFRQRGGKLILTTGSADSVVPFHATIDYYERVIEHAGGLETARSFCKLYVIPGMAHGNGPGINNPPGLLKTMREWRENGVAPKAIVGKRVVDGVTTLEMPIYPYPTKTGWDPATSQFVPVEGPRGGVERVAERFRPAAR